MKMDKELLLKYIAGDCSDQEKVDITEWLDFSAENMQEYLALRKLYDITIWQTLPASSAKAEGKKPHRLIYMEVVKIAAILILGIFISRYFILRNSAENALAIQTLHVPAGQRAEITLSEGTNVWLNAQTTIKFPSKFTGKVREIELDGEAFFDVTADKNHPFIVRTSRYDVKVLGTRFNLSAYSHSQVFETSLFEGLVEILKPGDAKGMLITPDEKAFLSNNELIKGTITNTEQFLWKEGIISFNNESFNEMAKKLELYFDLKIEIHNLNILEYRCTGKFRTKDGVEHILKVLQLSNKFNYTINDKRNTILIE